jgi:glycine oxidase
VTLPDIAVVGGGLLGRSLAWRPARAGARVVLYEVGSYRGENSAAWVAAGMIAPMTEAIDVDAEIVSIGKHSLSLWPQWLAELPEPVFYRDNGTLLLWHREDAGEAVRAQRKVASQHAQIKQIDSARTGELEPVLRHALSRSSVCPE